MISPKQIKRISPAQLQIVWKDQRCDIIPSLALRSNCPCAGCAEQRGDLNHSKPLSAPAGKKSRLSIVSNTIEEETNLIEVWGIGNYAIGCRWGDGHATGIYTYTKLREISDTLNSAESPSPLDKTETTATFPKSNTVSDH